MSLAARGGRSGGTRGTIRGGSRGATRGGLSGDATRGARPAAKTVRFNLNNAPGAPSGRGAPRGARGTADGRATVGRGASVRPSSRSGSPAQQQPAWHQNPALHAAGGNYDSRYSALKVARERERAEAIRDGFLADPDHPRPLSEAITPVGTCNDMCPEFERLERIVQKDVWAPEMDPETVDLGYGSQEPDEARMVKKFRRSAAGLDEQLPSDLRPPPVLQKTVDYLLGDIIDNAKSLASVHHFIWDRTRAVRNDFSIQQVNKVIDVRIAMDCYERIARFHILSLHQMAKPGRPDANYDYQQDKQQLDKTLFSLMQLYDDSKEKYRSPNEPEFRSYCILMAIQNYDPYLEDKIQSWPSHVLNSDIFKRVLRMYQAAGEVVDPRGPLKPQQPIPLAQQNWERFWKIAGSSELSYLLSCCAEMVFNSVRKTVLHTLWTGFRVAKANIQDLTANVLMEMLAFDVEDDVYAFCENYGFVFGETDENMLYLDLNSLQSWQGPSPGLKQQYFSQSLVERKRCGRTLSAVLQGMTVKDARTAGMIGPTEGHDNAMNGEEEDPDSLFVPEVPKKTTLNGGARSFVQRSTMENPFGPRPAEPGIGPIASMQPSNPFTTLQAPATSNPFQVNPFPTAPASQRPPLNPFGPPPAVSAPFQNPFGPKPVESTAPVNPFNLSPATSRPTLNPFDPLAVKGAITTTTSTGFSGVPSSINPAPTHFKNPFGDNRETDAPETIVSKLGRSPLSNPFTQTQTQMQTQEDKAAVPQQTAPKDAIRPRPVESATTLKSASAAVTDQQQMPTSRSGVSFGGLDTDTAKSAPFAGPSTMQTPLFQFTNTFQSPQAGLGSASSPQPPASAAASSPFIFSPMATATAMAPSSTSNLQSPTVSSPTRSGLPVTAMESRPVSEMPGAGPAMLSFDNVGDPDSLTSHSAAGRPPETASLLDHKSNSVFSGPGLTGHSSSVKPSTTTATGGTPIPKTFALGSMSSAALKEGTPAAESPAHVKPPPSLANAGSITLAAEVRPSWNQRKQQHFIRIAQDLFEDRDSGLLKQLLEYLASGVVASEMKVFQKEQWEATIAMLRHNIIARKWARIWSSIARVLRLKRQGRERRTRILAEREARAEKRSEFGSSVGSSQDLEDFRQSLEKDRKSEQVFKAMTTMQDQSISRPVLPTTSIFDRTSKTRSVRANHRRSRTQPTNSLTVTTPKNTGYRVSKPSSAPKRSLHHAALAASMQVAPPSTAGDRGPKVGTMKNNYFKLKAMGVTLDLDDGNPLMQSRSASGMKRGHEEPGDSYGIASKRRISPATYTTGEGIASKYRRVLDEHDQASASAKPTAAANTSTEDDELFARLRNIRETLAESANWYKTEREREEERHSRSSSAEFRNSQVSIIEAHPPVPGHRTVQPLVGSFLGSHGSPARHSSAGSPPRSLPKFWGRESFFVKREDYGKTKAQREQERSVSNMSRQATDDADLRSRVEEQEQALREATAARESAALREGEAQKQRQLEEAKKKLATAAADALESKGEHAFVGKGKAPITAALHNPFSASNGPSNGFSPDDSNPFGAISFDNAAFDTTGSPSFLQAVNSASFVDPSSFGTPIFGHTGFGQEHTHNSLSNGFAHGKGFNMDRSFQEAEHPSDQAVEVNANSQDMFSEPGEPETNLSQEQAGTIQVDAQVNSEKEPSMDERSDISNDAEDSEDTGHLYEEEAESFDDDTEAFEEGDARGFYEEEGYEDEYGEEDYRAESAESLPSQQELRMGGNSVEDAIEL